jgi:hypothetical protein
VISVQEAASLAKSSLFDVPGYEVRVASESEILRAAQDNSDELSVEFVRQAFLRGDICIAAFSGNQLVSYGWCSEKATLLSEDLLLTLGPGYFYGYKANTLRLHRGKGLHAAVTTYAGRELAARNGKGMIGYVNATNDRSLTSATRSGKLRAGLAILWRGESGIRAWYSRISRRAGIQLSSTSPANDPK